MKHRWKHSPLLLRADVRGRKRLWPIMFLNFEYLDNFPTRSSRLCFALHLALLGSVCFSAAISLTLFLVLVFAQSGLLRLDPFLGSLTLTLQHSLMILIISGSLLFLPFSIILFAISIFAKLFKLQGIDALPVLYSADTSLLPVLITGIAGFSLIIFFYLDLEFVAQSSRSFQVFIDIQGSSLQQRKLKSAYFALELLEKKYWNLPAFRDFFWVELEAAIDSGMYEEVKAKQKEDLRLGKLSQETAFGLLSHSLEQRLQPKPRSPRGTRKGSAPKETKAAS